MRAQTATTRGVSCISNGIYAKTSFLLKKILLRLPASTEVEAFKLKLLLMGPEAKALLVLFAIYE